MNNPKYPNWSRGLARSTILILLALSAAACATQPVVNSSSAPGFIMGLIHGLLAPLSLIGGLLTEVRIYAFPNTGWWYDFGFLLGLTAWGGGATAAAQ